MLRACTLAIQNRQLPPAIPPTDTIHNYQDLPFKLPPVDLGTVYRTKGHCPYHQVFPTTAHHDCACLQALLQSTIVCPS